MSTRVVLRPRAMEHIIQPDPKPKIHETHKNYSFCGILSINGRSQVNWGSRNFANFELN